MKHFLTLSTFLFAVLFSLTAGSAFPGQPIHKTLMDPLAISVTGGGCSNCMPGFPLISCDLPCTMPLGAGIVNNSDFLMLVEVTLTISLPDPSDCGNASDTQTAQYLIPSTGEAQANFSHSFAGAFSGAQFSASAVVVDSEDPGQIGYAAQTGILVGTSWVSCGTSMSQIKNTL